MDSSLFLSNSSSSAHEVTIEDIEYSVVEFLRKIEWLLRPVSSLDDLTDGVILMDLLSRINNSQFKMDEIEQDTKDNWALNHKNLTCIVKSLESYYHEILKITHFDASAYLELVEISRNRSKKESIKLFELVLGVIVQSNSKSDYILLITQLDRKSQAILMNLIEKWIVQERLQFSEIDGGNNSTGIGSHGNGGIVVDDYKWMEDVMGNSRLSMNSSGISQYNSQAYNPLQLQQQQQQMKELLKKIDELEYENNNLADRFEKQKSEMLEQVFRVSEFETQVKQKEEEIKKLKLSKEGLMMSLGLNQNSGAEGIQGVVKEKDMRIALLNKRLEEAASLRMTEKEKIEGEMELLNRKLRQLSKSNESLEFYKEKYDEYAQLTAKLEDADAHRKEVEGALKEKESLLEMLKVKLQEFKTSFQEERKKGIEKSIYNSELENRIEAMKGEISSLEAKCKANHEQLRESIETIQRMGEETESNTKQSSRIPKGLNSEFNDIISELQRENWQLRNELDQGKNGSNHNGLGSEEMSLEDARSLHSQIEILQTKLGVVQKEKVEFEVRLAELEKLDVQLIKAENDKLKEDYHGLLTKSISRQERLAVLNAEEAVNKMSEDIARKDVQVESLKKAVKGYELKQLEILEVKKKLEDGYERKIEELSVAIQEVKGLLKGEQNARAKAEQQLSAKETILMKMIEKKNEDLASFRGLIQMVKVQHLQQVEIENKMMVSAIQN